MSESRRNGNCSAGFKFPSCFYSQFDRRGKYFEDQDRCHLDPSWPCGSSTAYFHRRSFQTWWTLRIRLKIRHNTLSLLLERHDRWHSQLLRFLISLHFDSVRTYHRQTIQSRAVRGETRWHFAFWFSFYGRRLGFYELCLKAQGGWFFLLFVTSGRPSWFQIGSCRSLLMVCRFRCYPNVGLWQRNPFQKQTYAHAEQGTPCAASLYRTKYPAS